MSQEIATDEPPVPPERRKRIDKYLRRSRTMGENEFYRSTGFSHSSNDITYRSETQIVRGENDKDWSNSPKTTSSNKSRNEQFCRLFPDISDHVINSYHCALVGDVLLQGILYVTHSWFCFHSKVLAKKTIKIPVSSIKDIVKVNMVMIIPNAIGIYTAADKYVFGSLITRRNTFRVLVKVWQEHTKGIHGVPENSEDVFDVANNNHTSESLSVSEHTSSSKSEGSQDQQAFCNSSDDRTSCDPDEESVYNPDSPPLRRFDSEGMPPTEESAIAQRCSAPPGSCVPPEASEVAAAKSTRERRPKLTRMTTTAEVSVDGDVLLNQAESQEQRRQSDAVECRRKSFPSTGRREHSNPQTIKFLVLFTVIVLCLSFIAVYFAYKLVHLQARIDAYVSLSDGERPQSDMTLDSYSDADALYRQRHEEHMTAVDRLRSIIEAHVRLLDEVNQSLKGLCTTSAENVFNANTMSPTAVNSANDNNLLLTNDSSSINTYT